MYVEAYKWSGKQVREEGLGVRQVARAASEKFGIKIGRKAVKRASEAVLEDPDGDPYQLSPRMRGPPPKFPRALEKVLVSTTLALRELRATIISKRSQLLSAFGRNVKICILG